MRSFSSLSHEPLCSATHEKANACVSSNFSLLLSSPFLNCCLGRDWFLLPCSCQKKMNYFLLYQNCFHHPQFHSFFNFIPNPCPVQFLVPWQRQRINQSLSPKTALEKLGCTVTEKPGIWKTHETEGEAMIFTKLWWLFLGDIQWKRCRVKPSTLEAQLPLIHPFSASDQPTTSACQGCLPKLPNDPPSHTWQS